MNGFNQSGMSRRAFLRLCGVASVGTLGAALVGCGGSGQQAPATSAAASSSFEPVTLRVAFMPNLGSASSLFTAIQQGYFQEYGITVEPQQFDGGPAEIAAMASGDIDISQIGHGAHALCIQGQATVFAFDQLSKADAVVANKSKGISSAADLKGKTVGVTSGTSSEIILQYVLQDAGLTKDDINTVEMKVDGMTTALISGQIDAAATWSPNTVTLEQQLGDNYLVLGTNTDYSDKVAFPGSFICTPQFDKDNKKVLERFGAAIDKAQFYRAAHIEDVAKMLASKLGLPEETLVKSTGEGDWQGAADALGKVDTVKGYYEAQQKVFIDGGKIDAAVPVENYVDLDVMQKAYELYEQTK